MIEIVSQMLQVHTTVRLNGCTFKSHGSLDLGKKESGLVVRPECSSYVVALTELKICGFRELLKLLNTRSNVYSSDRVIAPRVLQRVSSWLFD